MRRIFDEVTTMIFAKPARCSVVTVLLFLWMIIDVAAGANRNNRMQLARTSTGSEHSSSGRFGLLVNDVSGEIKRIPVSGEDSDVQIAPSFKNRTVPHFKATLLTMLLGFGLILRDRIHPVLLIVTAILYLVEISTCSTRRYLTNSLSPNQLWTYLEKLSQEGPSLRWRLECYHYRENHSRKYGEREKIVTYRDSREFGPKRYVDKKKLGSTRIKLRISRVVAGRTGRTLGL